VLFVRGSEPDEKTRSELIKSENNKALRSTSESTGILLFCFLGLQCSYLTWGYLQEMIMTQEYVNGDRTARFKDSQFLVFVNRILAFLLSGAYLLRTEQPKHTAPLYKYSYCSLSNILSSWCQYEALKYVSFLVQILAKATKVIPYMVMGKIVSNKKYENYEYITAGMICVGMFSFLLYSDDDRKGKHQDFPNHLIVFQGSPNFPNINHVFRI
jgi:adenosine 3'-phospho 5'-phosphosulfate transporter B2